jgi:hypothetical protein
MNPRAELVRHPWRFTVLTALVGAFAAGLVAMNLPPVTRVSLSFTINQRQQETPDYSYDGYYALRAAELFADTVISWFSTPAPVSDMYRAAGITLAEGEAVEAAGRFRAKKLSAQVVTVTYSEKDRARAEALAKAGVAVAGERTAELNKNAQGRSLFDLIAAEPVISASRFPPERAAVIGFLLGAAFAAAGLYFSQTSKP